MQLLTEQLKARFAQIGNQEGKGEDAIVVAKFFTPDSSWTWLATEFDPTTGEFFGLVQGFEMEFGYFSLAELESSRGPLGLPIERDLYWSERSIRDVKESIGRTGAA